MSRAIYQHYIFFLKGAFEQSVLRMISNLKWQRWYLKRAAFRLAKFANDSMLPQEIGWKPNELVYEYVPFSKRNDDDHNDPLLTIDEILYTDERPFRFIICRDSRFSENETIAVKLYSNHIAEKFSYSQTWYYLAIDDSDFQRVIQSTTNSVLETTSQSWVASSDPSSLPSFSDNITKIYNGTTLFVNPNEILNDANNSTLSNTLWMIGGMFVAIAMMIVTAFIIYRIVSYYRTQEAVPCPDESSENRDTHTNYPPLMTSTDFGFYSNNEENEYELTHRVNHAN